MLAFLKEIAGCLRGALLVAPWLRDFARRASAAKLDDVSAKGSVRRMLQDLQAEDVTWLSKPKAADLTLTVSGLILVSIALGISLYLTWPF